MKLQEPSKQRGISCEYIILHVAWMNWTAVGTVCSWQQLYTFKHSHKSDLCKVPGSELKKQKNKWREKESWTN